MFVYENNKQVKSEFKKVVIDQNTTMTAIAEKCGMIPQQLNNRFRNDRLALSDLKIWSNAMGCDLVIDFVPTNNVEERKKIILMEQPEL